MAAVLLHALAFFVLDIGTRPPGRLLADVRAGFSAPRAFLRGFGRFVLGIALLLAGAEALLGLALVDIRAEFFVLETGAIGAGLIVEMLVGEPLRQAFHPK